MVQLMIFGINKFIMKGQKNKSVHHFAAYLNCNVIDVFLPLCQIHISSDGV